VWYRACAIQETALPVHPRREHVGSDEVVLVLEKVERWGARQLNPRQATRLCGGRTGQARAQSSDLQDLSLPQLAAACRPCSDEVPRSRYVTLESEDRWLPGELLGGI
jgi:hypothetical protein